MRTAFWFAFALPVALACDPKPAAAGTSLPVRVDHFRHNGNDCYYMRGVKGYAISCVPAQGYGR